MFEMMLIGGQPPKIQYPNSGPGPKTLLFGDESLGYFGEVTSDIFLTVPELQDQLSFYAGGSIPEPNVSWVKVFSDSKVLYIPKRSIVTGISWNTLYDAGLVYGIDGVGLYPTATPTNQMRIVTVANRQFKVRLLKGATIDPAGTINWTNPATQLAEFPLLLAAMVIGVPAAVGMPKWGIYPNGPTTFIGQASYAFTQNTANTGAKHVLSNSNAVRQLPTTELAWFPTLELIPLE